MSTIWKISWLCSALFASTLAANAQSRVGISFNLAPVYGYANTQRDLGLLDYKGQPLPAVISSQSTQMGYSLGIMGHYSWHPRWSLSTGVWMRYLRAERPTIQVPINIDVASYGYRGRNIQLPLLINYQLFTNRLRPYFSVGLLTNFRSKTYLEAGPDQEIAVVVGKRDITFLPTLGAGLRYRLNHHFSLVGQPTVKFVLPEYEYIRYRSYELSFQTQLLYTF